MRLLKPVLAVAAGIICRDSLYLAAQRPPEKHFAGFWEFPGGKLRDGEEALAALCRELGEELGILVRRAELRCTHEHQYPDGAVRLHFFHVREFVGEPRAVEGQNLAWITLAEARRLPFLEADLLLLAELEREAPAVSENIAVQCFDIKDPA